VVFFGELRNLTHVEVVIVWPFSAEEIDTRAPDKAGNSVVVGTEGVVVKTNAVPDVPDVP
jgi:L-fucose isomerase-like protein